MNKFKVINPKGFSFGGKLLKQGETFEAQNKSAHVQTGLHFRQIATHEGKEPAKEPEGKSSKDKEPAK